MRPAVDEAIGRDLRAEVPPHQAFGLGGLDWGGTLMRAVEDRGVFYPTVEEGAVRVFVCCRLRSQCGPERQLAYCAKAARQLGGTGIVHTPTALQGRLTHPQLSGGGDHAQLVPTPLEHWRDNLGPAITQPQAGTLATDREN
jgi:hypothetical protein